MCITVLETPLSALPEYGAIPSIITVREVLDVVEPADPNEPVRLVSRVLETPFLKDYDAPPAIPPTQWQEHFDVRRWGFLTARVAGQDVGRAAVAWKAPPVELFDNRDDLAVLWDLRVHPAWWRQGVGAVLFSAAERWARARGARTLKVETQNVNVPACRFYESRGCALRSIQRDAYRELPNEVQFLWYKDL